MKGTENLKLADVKDANLKEAIRSFRLVQDFPSVTGPMEVLAHGLENLSIFLAKKEK